MPNDKLFTAKEAAQAVLAKAHEMLAKSEFKSNKEREAEGKARQAKIAQKEIANNIGPRAGSLGDSLKAQAEAAEKPKMGKAEDGMKAAPSTDKNAPAEKDQSGPDSVQNSPNPAAPNDKVNGNPAPGAFPQNEEKYAAEGKTRGHIKLAKFVGRMEQKRKAKAAPAPAQAEKPKAE